MILKNILQIYALLVCLICTVVLIITTGLILNGITDLMIPQYKNYSSLLRYESNESYLNYLETKDMYGSKDTVNKEFLKVKGLSSTQIDEKRAFAKKTFLEEQKGYAIQGLITTFQWALVALFFFFIHWRLYKRSKESNLSY